MNLKYEELMSEIHIPIINTEHSLFLTLYVYYFTADFELLKTMYNVKLLMIPTDLYEAGLVDDLLSDGPVILQTKGASQY